MHDLQRFLSDEAGSVVSAELVTIGTVVTLGAVVGMQEVSSAVNEELRDVSQAIRSLNQSYSYYGMSGCHSTTAGSSFADPRFAAPVQPMPPVQPPGAPETTDASPSASEFESEMLFENDDSSADALPGAVTPADDKL